MIIIALSLGGQVRAEIAGMMGTAVPGSNTHWQAAEPLAISAEAPAAPKPRRVRIGLKLIPYKKIITRQLNGKIDSRYLQAGAMRHTLKARLNEPNHFYLGDWHIETVPTKWTKQTGHYEVQLRIAERFGPYGQLEEDRGSLTLSGKLEEQERSIDVLVGVARQRFRDKFGNPQLDVIAGYLPEGELTPLSMSAGSGSTATR
ncbi:MAG: hypothetical protein FJ146_11460 [Deltaproteobacteria bacterium]|nr:hypothetical protein [Deltaproteobacteria bacterium]